MLHGLEEALLPGRLLEVFQEEVGRCGDRGQASRRQEEAGEIQQGSRSSG